MARATPGGLLVRQGCGARAGRAGVPLPAVAAGGALEARQAAAGVARAGLEADAAVAREAGVRAVLAGVHLASGELQRPPLPERAGWYTVGP